MSLLHARAVLLTAVVVAASLPDVLLGGSSTSALVGSFIADGTLSGTVKENGVTQTAGYPLNAVPLQFTSAHGALIVTLHGTWKVKKKRYSANFDQSFVTDVAGAYEGAKVTGKFRLKKLEVIGGDLTTKVLRNHTVKKTGYKLKVKAKGLLIGVRV